MDPNLEDEMDAFFREHEEEEDGIEDQDMMALLTTDLDASSLSTEPYGAARPSPTSAASRGKRGKRTASNEAYQKKKEYNRMRNQKLREAEKMEALTLRNQAAQLEVLIKNLVAQRGGANVSTEMLPWKDVAGIFGQMKDSSVKEKANLVHKVKSFRDVAFVMHQWVNSNHHLPAMPDPYKQTWRNSALMAHEGSRALGFDWISKQLYHNIDAMIAHCGLPASLDTCNEVKVYPLENQNSYHLSKARQRIEHASLEEVVQCLRRQYFEGKTDNLDVPDTANMCYFRNKSAYGATANVSYTQNVLLRQFLEENRYIVLAHSITEDEKFPVDRIQRNWTNWTVAERLGPNMTIIKQMSVASGLRMNETFLPFDKYPSIVPPDMDAEQAFREFEQTTQAYHQYIFAKEVKAFRDLLAQVREENAANADE
ncbi:hypothetical protein LEN26_011495 [Aphanomyces euteiches]|nr:hypothetical protein LEN26_011495 [Aphanomyces euteiches]